MHNGLFLRMLRKEDMTGFFRDAPAFEAFAAKIVPQMFTYADGQADGQADVRVWVPGCGRGEDAYSIAILLREHMLTLATPPRVLIFATNADPTSLAIARDACYPLVSLHGVSASRLERFFHRYSQSYAVAEDVRRLCVVAPHEVTRDAPFSHLDLIVCGDLQARSSGVSRDDLLATFHYALKPGGVLFLVAAEDEDLVSAGELFSPIEKTQSLFRRRAIVHSNWSPHWSPRIGAKQPEVPSKWSSGAEVNEELQCSNEELLTSKEELLSTNEELYTVNNRLASKIEELNRANQELRTLCESAQIGSLLLDRCMVVRNYTPSIATIFNLAATDRGRPLTDFAHQIEDVDLLGDIQQVLQRAAPLERAVRLRERKVFHLMRILPYRNASDEIDGVLVTFVNVTNVAMAEEQQRLMVAELNHRVRNMLQVVISLANQTLQRSGDLLVFERAFMGRMQALSRAYQLLSRDSRQSASIKELLQTQLEPFAAERRYSALGENFILTPEATVPLALIIYELGTNAIKYGALSVAEGYVDVSWALSAGNGLVLNWIERNGPLVKEPTHRGFGSQLLQRQLSYELSGTVAMEFDPGGLRVRIDLPAHHLAVLQDSASAGAQRPALDR
jgi:two-component sensor histidine kinase/chemotaxis methyl-accepting protein methylase